MISIALITLGIQLSKTKFQIRNRDAYTSVLVRLLVALYCLYPHKAYGLAEPLLRH